VLVRCERCRAVYQYEVPSAASSAAVQCARCQHVFVAAPLTVLGVVGTLGGAAEQAVAAMPRLVPRRRRRWIPISPLSIVGLSAVVAVSMVGVAALVARTRHVSDDQPAASTSRADAGEVLLWRDDDASLQSAIAAFSEAHALDPGNPSLQAQRALATMLLGLSLRTEADCLASDLNQLGVSLASGTVSAAAEKEATQGRADDLRKNGLRAARLAASLIHDGVALATAAEGQARGPVKSMPVERASLLAAAIEGRNTLAFVPQSAWLQSDHNAPTMEAWRAFTAGLARLARSPSALDWAAAQSEFDLASRISPRFLRAKWELAKASLACMPPDRSRARAALNAILQLNPSHEGAARSLILAAAEKLSLP
jgi:hypothetical protein